MEVLEPGKAPVLLEIAGLQDEMGEPLSAANHPMAPAFVKSDLAFQPGSILRKQRID